jgi:uncharacterized protein YjeT (DUF2065 family)
MTNLLALALVLVLSGIGPALAADANLEAAKEALQTARTRLKAAQGDFEGHRTHAVSLVDSALEQVNAGLKVDTRHEHKDEQKAGQIEKKIDRLEKKKGKLEAE